MSCERPYRPALSYRQCLAELRRCAGTQFDPEMVAAFLRALRRLRRRRTWVTSSPRRPPQLIDPAAHAVLRSRADEERPEYHEMVAALRALPRRPPAGALRHDLRADGDQCITVLDTGETEDEVSHCGDPWLAEDELARVLAGEVDWPTS